MSHPELNPDPEARRALLQEVAASLSRTTQTGLTEDPKEMMSILMLEGLMTDPDIRGVDGGAFGNQGKQRYVLSRLYEEASDIYRHRSEALRHNPEFSERFINMRVVSHNVEHHDEKGKPYNEVVTEYTGQDPYSAQPESVVFYTQSSLTLSMDDDFEAPTNPALDRVNWQDFCKAWNTALRTMKRNAMSEKELDAVFDLVGLTGTIIDDVRTCDFAMRLVSPVAKQASTVSEGIVETDMYPLHELDDVESI